LDLDGVLEGAQFGFPALTPASALALRSLLAHGYRPVLATGRSLDEAAERCRAYGLAGAVAEYGSVTFRTADGRVRSLLGERETDALERLRAWLRGLDGVVLDPCYEHAVRAFDARGGRGGNGWRGPLPARLAAEAIALAGGGVEAIVGDGQTDFVASTVDKGSGLRALATALACPPGRPCALAVGDSAPDLPLAQTAALACAPRHADPVLARGFQIMRSPYQAGLAQAVSRLLGHAPGGCARCSLPSGTPERALTRSLLGVAEHGRAGIVKRGLELWWRAR
ncbi:MAG: HAD family hydrolase, partial [Solirubrobacteraceae bacterium]